jgi:hypothetical protein
MGSREDDDYWNDLYAEDPECEDHGTDEMYYDHQAGEYYCLACQREDELTEVYKRG